MKLLLATTNKGKVIEIGEVLTGLPISLITPMDCGITESPHEHAPTFAENAALKAQFYFSQTKLPTLADDSGILIEALAGELGVQTRRWGAGPEASDEEWISFFLERMKKERNKRAHFVCALSYIDAEGTMYAFERKCSGSITETLEADYLPGLPISACFKPDSSDRVFSALSLEQKNSTSHRGRAVFAFRNFLEEKLITPLQAKTK